MKIDLMILKDRLLFIPVIFAITANLQAAEVSSDSPEMAQNITSLIGKISNDKTTIVNSGTEKPAATNNTPAVTPPKNQLPFEIGKIFSDKNQIPSLMFNDQELDDINRAIDSLESGQSFVSNDNNLKEDKITDNAKSFIYLGSILYHSPTKWAVWLNDKKISSDNNNFGEELYVKSISSDAADILWTISSSKWKALLGKRADEFKTAVNKNNQVEVSFHLKPNQTFMLLSNKVVEGRVADKVVENKEFIDKKPPDSE